MLFTPRLVSTRFADPLDRLTNRITLAETPDRALIDDIIATVCSRFQLLKAAGKTRQFDAWCDCEAWVDAANALVALELPAWSIRRIARDGGMWLCSLSRVPDLPAEFDDVIEVSHEALPLAILAALVETKRWLKDAPSAIEISQTNPAECHRVCCDDFS